MMSVPNGGPYQIFTWPKKNLEAHLAFLNSFNKELRESGEFVAVEGLMGPDQAKVVRAGRDGTPITDGVFQKPKSFSQATGWLMLRVRSEPMRSRLACRRRRDPAGHR
jgi:hypothetical protein